MSVFFIHLRRGAVVVLALLAAACSALAESGSMNDKPDGSASAVQLSAQLTVAHFDTGEPKRVDIRYRIDNAGASPIGVLSTAGSTTGDPPRPIYAISKEGDLTVACQLHAPRRLEAAAVPQNVYATRVAPGEHYVQQLSVKLLSAYPNHDEASGLVRPKRVRFCQAYAVHSPEHFTPLTDNQDHWLARPSVLTSQEILCSEWIELPAG